MRSDDETNDGMEEIEGGTYNLSSIDETAKLCAGGLICACESQQNSALTAMRPRDRSDKAIANYEHGRLQFAYATSLRGRGTYDWV